jgi:ATP-dependent exoDNAse (exonuclease V) beta subunit
LFNLIRREHRLFAVGDINQSIYGFRHAEPDLFAAYRDNLSTQGFEIDDLRDNYRSREGILQSVELLLEGISGIEPRPLISKANYPKTEDYDLEIIYGPGENGPDIEAGLLAKRIRELENTLIIGTDNPRPAQLSDIAILGRSFSALDPITHALDRFGIPYIVNAGRTFLEAREVRDLMLLLSVIANPRDQIALAGVLRSPLVGASEEDIYRHLQNLPMPEGALTTFLHQLEQARAQRDSIAPDLLLARFLDASGYEANLPERARANIEKFLALLSNLSRRESRTTAELLAYLERLRIAQSEAEAAPSASGNMVQVLTFHAAKGLEWPIVFVVGLHRRPDNRMNSILYSPDHGLGLRWRNPIDGKTHGDPNWDAMRDREKVRSVREESRLLYVAMTRAQERLVLSYSEAKQPAAIIPSIQSAQSTIADRFITAEHPPVPEAVATQAGAAAASITIPAARKPESTRSTAAVTELAHTFEFTGWRPRAAAEFGTSAHAWLAGHFRGLNPDPNTSAGRLARGFLESALGRQAAGASRREVEFDFLYPLPNGTLLRGQIDLWFESAGRLVIVDYKTDQELNPRLYERQLRLYAVALQSYAGQTADEAWLYDLRKNTAIRIELSEQALFEAVNGVQNFGG